jgi:tetratricopeptide (TPR) repeat protein
MTVRFQPSDDNSPPTRAEIDDLLCELDIYPGDPLRKGYRAKARRLLNGALDRARAAPGTPVRFCFRTDDGGDFTESDLINLASACNRWVTFLRHGGEGLYWVREAGGYVLLRGVCRDAKLERLLERHAAPPAPRPASGPAVYWREFLPDPQIDRLFVDFLNDYLSRTPPRLARALQGFRAIEEQFPAYPWAPSLVLCSRLQLLDYCYSDDRPGWQELETLREKVGRSGRECYSHAIAEGIFYYQRHQVLAAIECFRQAKEVYPYYYAADKWLAEALMTAGETEAALAAIDVAIRLAENRDPFLHGIHAHLLIQAGRSWDALVVLDREVGAFDHPKNCALGARAHHDLALQCLERHDREGAADQLIQAEQLLLDAELLGEGDSAWLLTEKLHIYWTGRDLMPCKHEGFEVKAVQVRRLLDKHPDRCDHPGQEALRLVAMGLKNQALRELERAVESRDPLAVNLELEPRFRGLRGEPLFIELCAAVRQRFVEDRQRLLE